MEQVKLWPVNSLPVPFPAVFERAEEVSAPPEIDVNDNFPKGRVFKYFPNQGIGYIKDRSEREIFFNLDEMGFAGSKGKDSIKEGAVVGYDLSQSGRGLHVRKMKVY